MYIRRGEPIRDGLKQKFENQMMEYRNASARKTMQLISNHIITPQDIEIVLFVYKFRLATIDQIIRAFGISEKAKLIKRLDLMVKNRILNRFMVCDDMEPVIKEDAEFIYCANANGVVIVDHYTDDHSSDTWTALSVEMTSTKANKFLMNTEFYLALKKAIPNKIKYYTTGPVMFFRQFTYRPLAVFSIVSGGSEKIFILDGASATDIKDSYATKFTDRIMLMDRINVNSAWQDYTGTVTPPVIFFISDSNEALKAIARILSNTSLKAVRYCTTQTIKDRLSEAFMKFDGSDLKKVSARMFE